MDLKGHKVFKEQLEEQELRVPEDLKVLKGRKELKEPQEKSEQEVHRGPKVLRVLLELLVIPEP